LIFQETSLPAATDRGATVTMKATINDDRFLKGISEFLLLASE
jgi:hypothetical protein